VKCTQRTAYQQIIERRLRDTSRVVRLFTRRRPRVEGSSGIIKNPTWSHLCTMRIRVRGRTKVSIFSAFLTAVHNLKLTGTDRVRPLPVLGPSRTAARHRPGCGRSRRR